MNVLDRQKLMLALRGQYRDEENVKAAWGQEMPETFIDNALSICVEGLQPLAIPIPKQMCIKFL